MSKEKDQGNNKGEENRLGQELWGVLFLAFGLLIFISLISHLINSSENILGPVLGNYLSSGLIYLFGSIPSFILPSVIIYTAIVMFRGFRLPIRNLIFSILLTVEACILLTIHNLPTITQENFSFSNNCIGNAATFLLHYIFGAHSFGPYFLFILAIFVTLALMFQINIRDAVIAVWNFNNRSVTLLFTKAASLIKHFGRKEVKESTFTKDNKPVDDGVVLSESEKAESQLKESEESQDEDEAAEALEKQLEEFRAKKNEPIVISTPDQPIDEINEEEEDDLEDTDIEDLAKLDPSLIDMESDEDEFFKVPSLEVEKRKKRVYKPYKIPSPDILIDPPLTANIIDREKIEINSHILEKTLLNFGVEGKVVNVSPGPVVTRYEIELAPGIKISKIVNLHDDLSMAVGGKKIRIEAPIPGKAAIGIELPNDEKHVVHFKTILISDAFRKTRAKLPMIIGKNISGNPYVSDIAKMPHLLIAGQTGSGKSVAINSILCSLLMTKTPDELRMILIDPKKVEMSYYENIPHLISPVVTESKEAVKALQWGVVEMSRRYRLLAKVHARNIDSFNQKIEGKSIKEGIISENDNKRLPFIVIIVDELADLMLTASRDVEGLVQRIAQLARAVGIHLIVSTQRPSVDIITGPIKANLTSRMAFRTIQSVDSRTILGYMGAEKLLGNGDMLFLRSGAPDIERYHGSFISEQDVEAIVADIRSQNIETDKIESFESATLDSKEVIPGVSMSQENERDEKFEEAARLIVSTGLGSTSLLQRRLKLGYARAGRLMDELHNAGIVGPQEGSKAREVLITSEVLEDMLGN